ncbi:unnamed protein product [Amoebophrya sp. A120]|nr:unnamed protein product [Amoebophrya sp. A120]|eukprot:GSA120T00025097001.1
MQSALEEKNVEQPPSKNVDPFSFRLKVRNALSDEALPVADTFETKVTTVQEVRKAVAAAVRAGSAGRVVHAAPASTLDENGTASKRHRCFWENIILFLKDGETVIGNTDALPSSGSWKDENFFRAFEQAVDHGRTGDEKTSQRTINTTSILPQETQLNLLRAARTESKHSYGSCRADDEDAGSEINFYLTSATSSEAEREKVPLSRQRTPDHLQDQKRRPTGGSTLQKNAVAQHLFSSPLSVRYFVRLYDPIPTREALETALTPYKQDSLATRVHDEFSYQQQVREIFEIEKRHGPIRIWDLSQVEDFSNLFTRAFFFDLDISQWDVSGAKTMVGMFSGAVNFNKPIQDWDVSSVTTMDRMFFGASNFNQPLNDWNVSNVTDMSGMFMTAREFNQPLDKWDVSTVRNMASMFFQAAKFKQSLRAWDITRVVWIAKMSGSGRVELVMLSADSKNICVA